MKLNCKETNEYINSTESIKASVKGLNNFVAYFKQYLDKTKDYMEKVQALNDKFKNNKKATAIDGYFSRLQLAIDCQVSSYTHLMNLIETNIRELEKNIHECLECQKQLHKDYIDAETEFISQSKDIEKVKRQYHADAVTLEQSLMSFNKKQRNIKKKQDEEDNQEIQKAISNMKKSEKDYIKKSSKGKMFMQNFTDRIESTTGGLHHLLNLIENQTKEIVYFTMLSLQNSGKEIATEINLYSRELSQPFIPVSQKSIENGKEGLDLQDLTYEPYKIKCLLKEYQDDFTEMELHHIIKTIAKNMIKKPAEYDIKLEDEKIIFNGLVTKMLMFTSNDFCTQKEMQYIEKLVQTHLFRSIFLQRLNTLRISGMFSWPKEHYAEVGKIIAMILDAVEQENDIETAKNVIILSQTYYFKVNENKVYLQKFIKSHPLFESKAFWEEFMLESIQNELKNNKVLDAKLNQNMNESKADFEEKVSNIVLTQLVPIADNMIDFNFPKDEIIKILNLVLEKYPINESQRNIIFSVFEKDSKPQLDKEEESGNDIDEGGDKDNKKDIQPISINDNITNEGNNSTSLLIKDKENLNSIREDNEKNNSNSINNNNSGNQD